MVIIVYSLEYMADPVFVITKNLKKTHWKFEEEKRNKQKHYFKFAQKMSY